MTLKISISLAAALSAAFVAGTALGDGHADKAVAAAIKARQSEMQLRGFSLGILGAMAKGEAEYDAETATAAATLLKSLATMDRSIFWLEGSVQGEVPDTRAKAEIWTDAAGFDKAAADLENAADALVAAAGDLESLRGAMGPAGQACGACHDGYRGPRN